MKFTSKKAQEVISEVASKLKKSSNLKTKQEFLNFLDDGIGTINVAKSRIETLKDQEYKTLEEYSWVEIAQLIRDGKTDEAFAVGDEKTIELLSGEKSKLVIIGKDHDNKEDGIKAKLTFAFKECLDGEFNINPNSNAGGWQKSKMRNTYLRRIFNLLPGELKDIIVRVVKPSNDGDNKLEDVVDDLFLLSVREYTGTDKDSIRNEGEQYEYFKENKFTDNKYWWTRSPNTYYSSYWNGVSNYGNVSYNIVNGTNYVRPCFCIG